MKTTYSNIVSTLVSALALTASYPSIGLAGMAVFSRPTDTILVPGHIPTSGQITLEARFKCGTGTNWGSGDIFHEQYWGACDMCLQLNDLSAVTFYGGAYPDNGGIHAEPPSFATNAWHHLAFVRNSNVEWLYVDGNIIGSQSLGSSTIGSSSSSWMSVGSFQYTFYGENGWHRSFIGVLDWLRVSKNARYTGDTYTVPSEPSNDSNTLLLYNFNDAPGVSTIADLSNNHWDGQMGVGHFNWGPGKTPTPPTLVSDGYFIITSQPQSLVVGMGQPAKLSISVDYLTSVTIQWQQNGISIPGATNTSYTIPSAGIPDIGNYQAVVSSVDATNVSLSATLAVLDVQMFAGIRIFGPVGTNYSLQSVSALGNTNNWNVLTNVTLPSQPYIYMDYSSPTNRQQFYRAVPQ